MKKLVLGMWVTAAILVVLAVAAVVLAPLLIDLDSAKPAIEKAVAEATGRSFHIGGRIRFALFPYARFSLSDLSLGTPIGFSSPDFLSVESFEVRVKTLPLLWGDIQITRFRVDYPRLTLERLPDGRVSWEGLGRAMAEVAPPRKPPRRPRPMPFTRTRERGFRLKSLSVGDCAIHDGWVVWSEAGQTRYQIENLNANLQDVSLDRPIRASISAEVNAQPVSLVGEWGPFGREPGQKPMPVSLKLTVAQGLKVFLRGRAGWTAEGYQTDLALDVEPFSPRRLFQAFGQPFPVRTPDSEALNHLGLKARFLKTGKATTFWGGDLALDESRIVFSVKREETDPPRLDFELDVDRIDLNRYLPLYFEPKRAESVSIRTEPGLAWLRRMVIGGEVRIGDARLHRGWVQNLSCAFNGRRGLVRAEPVSCELYGGRLSGAATVDVRAENSRFEVQAEANGVRVQPLLRDFFETSFLEGTLDGSLLLTWSGVRDEQMRGSLDGRGRLRLSEGAVVGVDLAGMARGLKSAYKRETGTGPPRTPFSELAAAFTLKDGVWTTRETTLVAPSLRLSVSGRANLNSKTLNLRLRPAFSPPEKGRAAPIGVSGALSSPVFEPVSE